MFFFQAQNGARAGYSLDNAIVLLDAADAASLEQNANGLARWRDGSGEQNDLVAAAGGEPLVTPNGVYFPGNRSLELAVPFFPTSAQAYTEWTFATLITPTDLANQSDFAALFSPSPTASGNPNFLFYSKDERQWGVAAGGGGFPRIGAVTENVPQLLIVSSSASRQRIETYCTGTGDKVTYSGPLDNGVWNFGIGYGIRGTIQFVPFATSFYDSAQRLALRDQVAAQTGFTL